MDYFYQSKELWYEKELRMKAKRHVSCNHVPIRLNFIQLKELKTWVITDLIIYPNSF